MADRPTDVGRTMGGGSLGHAPADDAGMDAPLRNNPPGASQKADTIRQEHGARGQDAAGGAATGAEDDPVMPKDDATLKTTI